MKKLLGGLAALILGTGVGGAGAYGIGLLGIQADGQRTSKSEFVPTGTMLAPLTFADGRLSGYASFEVQIEVAQGEGESAKERLPLLLNAVNMRTYRTPLASGPDGLIPGLDTFRRVVMDAATETYGPGFVRRVVVTQASPV